MPGRPVLRVEVPAHPPDRHGRDEDRDDRQPDPEGALRGERQGVPALAGANREAELPGEPAAEPPIAPPRRRALPGLEPLPGPALGAVE